MLLYPASDERGRPVYLQIRGQDRSVKAHLRALAISIPQAIAEINDNTAGAVSTMLLEAVEEFVSVA